ncbi:hypothetical protein SeLEV6574_g03602 [Synchytrium endobioticum]|uniref:Uncharacterized protein n=2 Tax=Synchytrium endobioticum TaxID=286115 RepID=A0A507D3F0_9FUNG|nr:hypothetical protein SeLEV6574_g03602 [Synchytrium endobioticum]
MATTAACSIKATAMCLLWMVFLSASTARKRVEAKFAQEAAFNNIGTYGDGDDILGNEEKIVEFQWHVMCMNAKFLPIFDNLEPKLRQGGFLVEEKDFMELIDLRILVTTEKFPWPHGQFPAEDDFSIKLNYRRRRAEYNKYIELFNKCANMFQTRMGNVAAKLNEAYNNLQPKFDCGAYLGNEPDMETIRGIISHEMLIWGNDPEEWTQPHRHSENDIFLQYKEAYVKSSRLINAHDQKYGGYTTHLHESPMDTALQGTTNHGDLASVVASGVAEPIASNQQWPLFTSDGNAGTSYGYTYADRPELENIGDILDTSLSLSSRANEPIASNQQWPLFPSDGNAGTPYGYTYANTPEFGYNSIEGTTRSAHPPTSYDPAGPSSSYAGTGTPNTFTTSDSVDPSGYDSSGFLKWL